MSPFFSQINRIQLKNSASRKILPSAKLNLNLVTETSGQSIITLSQNDQTLLPLLLTLVQF